MTALEGDWAVLLATRERVNAALEESRARKEIGKALEADAVLSLAEGDPQLAVLRRYEAILPELFNVSSVRIDAISGIEDPVPSLRVFPSTHPRCERCWRHVSDVGVRSDYPTVCLRCAEALDAIGSEGQA